MPIISIIIPCYNQAQYLPETVESVLNQTLQDWECIIVDDGSTDNTGEVALALTKKDLRIKYLKKINGGISNARNYGIERANARWILPLDADDKICEFYLEYAVKEIKKNDNLGLVYCKACFFGEETGYWSLSNFDFHRLLFENHIFCSAIFQKSDWLRVGGYDSNMVYGFEDWEFWINILKYTNKEVVKLDYIGFMYRKKKESRSTAIDNQKDRIKMMHNYIYQKHKDIYCKYFGSFQTLASKYSEVSLNNQSYLNHINHSFCTKILFKIIRLFNKF